MKSNFVYDAAFDSDLFWQCPVCGNQNSHIIDISHGTDNVEVTIQCECCGCDEKYAVREYKGVVNLVRWVNWTSSIRK